MAPERPHTLHPWPHELPWHHRALILWTMLTPDPDSQAVLGRSTLPVVRAMQREKRSVQRVRRSKQWERRVLGHAEFEGEDPQHFAARYYRAKYLRDHGRDELPDLVSEIAAPLLALARGAKTIPAQGATEAQVDAKKLLEGLEPPGPDRSFDELRDVQMAVDERRARSLHLTRTYLDALRKMVDNWGEQVREGQIKLTRMADVTAAYELIQRLENERAQLEGIAPDDEETAAPVQETTRVRIAKARGLSVAKAVHTDLQELMIVSEQLQAMEDQAEIELALVGDTAEAV